MRSAVVAPLILISVLEGGERSASLPAILLPKKELGGSRNHFGRYEEKKNHFLLPRIELGILSLSAPSLVTMPTEEATFHMYKSIKKVQITSSGLQALAESCWGDGNVKTCVASSLFHETSFRIAKVLYREPSTGRAHVTRCDSSVNFICRNYLFIAFRQHQYYAALR
jgi:hypothetical protein